MSKIGDRLFKRTPAEADALVSLALQRDKSSDFSRFVAPVSREQAMRHSAVYAAATLIADIISTFTWNEMVEREGKLVKTAAQAELLTHPSYSIPSPIGWRFAALYSTLMEGNAFGIVSEVTQTGEIVPTKIELVNGNRVGFRQGSNGKPGTWELDHKPIDPWPLGLLWHFPGYVVPGNPLGWSVLRYAASAIGLGLGAEAFGRDWFTDGASPSGLLQYKDGKLTTEQAQEAKERWRDQFANRRDVAVLGGTWDYTQVQIQQNDSQFLETIQANVQTVARFFRIAPELIGGESGSSMTYTTLEGRNVSLNQLTLNPWTARFEENLSGLMVPGHLVKADSTRFTAPDQMTQARIEDMRIRNGQDSPNDARQTRGLDPRPGGDEYAWPPAKTGGSQSAGDGENLDSSTTTPAPGPSVPGGNLK